MTAIVWNCCPIYLRALKPLSCAVEAHFATYGELRWPYGHVLLPPQRCAVCLFLLGLSVSLVSCTPPCSLLLSLPLFRPFHDHSIASLRLSYLKTRVPLHHFIASPFSVFLRLQQVHSAHCSTIRCTIEPRRVIEMLFCEPALATRVACFLASAGFCWFLLVSALVFRTFSFLYAMA